MISFPQASFFLLKCCWPKSCANKSIVSTTSFLLPSNLIVEILNISFLENINTMVKQSNQSKTFFKKTIGGHEHCKRKLEARVSEIKTIFMSWSIFVSQRLNVKNSPLIHWQWDGNSLQVLTSLEHHTGITTWEDGFLRNAELG